MNVFEAAAIDQNNLDSEAIEVCAWFGALSDKESETSARLESLKDQLNVVKADLGLIVRGWTVAQINLTFGLNINKLTEDVYKNLVFIHPEVIKLSNEIDEARRDSLIYKAAVRSIEKKADMLKELAKLYSQGYFMKIEGKEYKSQKMDLVIEKIKEQTIRRIEYEAAASIVNESESREFLSLVDKTNSLLEGNQPIPAGKSIKSEKPELAGSVEKSTKRVRSN